MGRPRKPTKVLELHGAFVKHPERKAKRAREPKPPVGLGEPPKYFDAADRDAWHELERICVAGVCTRMARPTAELLARTWAKYRRNELTLTGQRFLATLFGKFGLNPSDMSRVEVPAEAPGAENTFARLMSGKKTG